MSAVEGAHTEARQWAEITRLIDEMSGGGLDPTCDEARVTGFDPTSDLSRRARRWDHVLPGPGLAPITAFASALAQVEGEAWAADDATLATRAFEDRRFLLADRIIHWAVPWADVAGRCHPPFRPQAHRVRDLLLDIGDKLRPAPILTGDEGLHIPGEDSYGPVVATGEIADRLLLLGSGTVVFAATVESLLGRRHGRRLDEHEIDGRARLDLAALFDIAAGRWTALAAAHPGSARLWTDLSDRARRTASEIGPSDRIEASTAHR